MNRRPERSPSGPGPDRLLAIYLNDHLAGSAAGAALVRRMTRAHRGTRTGRILDELRGQIDEDRDSLRQIMARLGVSEKRVRSMMARLGEKAGHLKPNARLVRRSPLSDVLELEMLRLGVEGKLALWRALSITARRDPRIDGDAVGLLAVRAGRQIDALEELRADAVARTFAPPQPSPDRRRLATA
ncbi:hypothetical protein AB0F18_33060 [Streptomyces sp. NPDC029216]|uniref:hypothetical protein n=1 Tax=Streptomyces sp. NPDC029216 TaxID=3154701 RepID=UPI00340465A0